MSIKLEKDILRNFFGQAAIAGHSQRNGEHHGLVVLDEFLEIRLPVAGHISRCYSLIRMGAEVGLQRVTFFAWKSSGASLPGPQVRGTGGTPLDQVRNAFVPGSQVRGTGGTR